MFSNDDNLTILFHTSQKLFIVYRPQDASSDKGTTNNKCLWFEWSCQNTNNAPQQLNIIHVNDHTSNIVHIPHQLFNKTTSHLEIPSLESILQSAFPTTNKIPSAISNSSRSIPSFFFSRKHKKIKQQGQRSIHARSLHKTILLLLRLFYFQWYSHTRDDTER